MARKPTRKEAEVIELADNLLRVLRAQRDLGADAYPLSLQRLVELTAPKAAPAVVKKALGKKTFTRQALMARAKAPDAPIALASDVDALAGCPLTLEFLLRQTRTAATQAFSPAALKKKAAGRLHKPIAEALARQLAQNTLPPTVAWISIRGRKLLFLLNDLHVSGQQAAVSTPQPAAVTTANGHPESQAPGGPPPADFDSAFDSAFDRLDRQGGGHNFVSLVSLRQALPVGHEQFDSGLRVLRRAGRYTLSAAEGRHGISPEERDAGITEEGSLLLFVSRNRP
ncbi:MAG: hypothetical protein L0Z62_05040 [Gemmataceae bacterium]|nr:hypothetical protein [Gemmataceae bacterium]